MSIKTVSSPSIKLSINLSIGSLTDMKELLLCCVLCHLNLYSDFQSFLWENWNLVLGWNMLHLVLV